MVVVVDGSVQDRATEAARAYVRVTRDRLQMQIKRYGAEVTATRSYRTLERSISPEELARTWPHADVTAARGE